ncbi:ATP synthase F1 subunit delta [Algisphaera agarilytica]|uniref:ATP synthase subunit delta n=1 Tax=Algisphaera agarilytica TaxID=1385975 RepID=A0A7X0LKY1_9BACT|nr:ATP synthase F1 subunit delta [Algisphaera agarilytica]MBB6430412.1 F-type H+-transporting ATPase subunit delta [Algisphaera agarilytica]
MPANPTDAIGRVYAQALVELAESENQLDSVAEEVADLSSLLESDADLVRLVENPIIDSQARAGMVERLFSGKVSDLLYRFLQVVNQKERLGSLPSITGAFGQIMAEKRNQLDVEAFVAQPMDDATAGRVANGLGASMGKQVNLVQHVDESLIGGLKLRIGDQMIDASVQSQLNRIEQQLIAAGREKARAAAAELD